MTATQRSTDAANVESMRLALLDEDELGGLRDGVRAQLASRGLEVGQVETALRAAPSSWTIGAADGQGLIFGEPPMLLAAGGLATAIRDTRESAPRDLTPDDVDDFCRLAEALPEVSLVEPPCVPGEDARRSRSVSVARALAATGKHVLAVCADDEEAAAITAMAGVLHEAGLRARPAVTIAVVPGPAATRTALIAAEAGLPCLIGLAPAFLGAADRRAALAAAFADSLSLVAAVQEEHPGAPVGLAVPPARRPPLDAGAPAAVAAAVQLAVSFGLPLAATMFATQAPASGWLASTENTLAGLACGLAGAAGLAGAGLLDGGATVSPHELIMDAEIFSYCRATGAGIPVDEETLAAETIAKVGIAGNYLAERHTRRHMRAVWRPRLFDRTSYEQWVREGRRQSYELADDFARRTLAEPPAPKLPDETAAALISLAQTVGKEKK